MNGRAILIAVAAVAIIVIALMAISPELFRSGEEGGDPPAHSLQTD